MSLFERTYPIDPAIEAIEAPREIGSIELSDEDFLRGFKPKPKKQYTMTATIVEKSDAKESCEIPEKKAKKVPAKRHKPAMARLQKKL